MIPAFPILLVASISDFWILLFLQAKKAGLDRFEKKKVFHLPTKCVV